MILEIFISALMALQVAGPTFLEPLQKRDSVLVWDQFRYGIELKNITEGTHLALPELDPEESIKGQLMLVQGWQVDSVKVSGRKEVPARYDIRAYVVLAPMTGAEYNLAPLKCLVGTDTLTFSGQRMDVKEPVIDMETFQPHDIKDQVKYPVTFAEALPWVLIGLFVIGILAMVIYLLVVNRKEKEEEKIAEPAHIRALRKLDRYRGDKYWKPEQQKTFYSGVTDALREYIAARFGFGAMEMTTAEIFEALKGSEDLTPELYTGAKDLFERADFVKFAKYTASDEDNATVLPTAVRFVSSTYLETIEEEKEGKE